MSALRSTNFALLVFLLFTFASSAFTSDSVNNSRTFYRWNVEYMHHSPDGREGIVMGINGQFPGPTIRARAGDTLHIELTNKLHTEGVVIHWHGIRQQGTPWADGTAAISQCAINPGETFVYRFKVDRPGTYFYHGHYGMQRSAGLYGALIVDVAEGQKEPFPYDQDRILLLSDWWHKTAHEQEVGLSSNPMRWIGEPQSLLINGRGQFNCSLAAHFSNSSTECSFKETDQWAPYILRVLPNKTYRIRIASTTALASLNFAIGNHKLIVVEADGNYVTPFEVDDLDIYSGESYSVLLKTNQRPTGNYWVSFSVRGRDPDTPPALTILHYGPYAGYGLPITPPPTAPLWNNYTHSKLFSNKITALMGTEKPPTTYDRRIVLLNTQNTIDGYTKWAINNISLHLTPTPYLGSIKHTLGGVAFDQTAPPDNFPSDYDVMQPPPNPATTTSSGVYTLELNKTIDVILQNANMVKPGKSEIHPWHLHGHDFWVLGYGEGKFTADDEKKFNLKNPPLRNTVVIYPHGWTALRFVTDNPGVWAFHCHIEPHLHLGMGVIFAEGVDRVKNIPQSALACGLTAKMFMAGTTNSTG